MSRRPYDRAAFERFRKWREMHARAQRAEALCNRALRAGIAYRGSPWQMVESWQREARQYRRQYTSLEYAMNAAGASWGEQTSDGKWRRVGARERVAKLTGLPGAVRMQGELETWRGRAHAYRRAAVAMVRAGRDLANENAALRARVTELERRPDAAAPARRETGR